MAVLGLASRGVRSTAVRLPRTVHNEGTGGFAGRAGRVPGDLEQPLAGKNTSPGSSGGPNSRQMARPSRSR